MITQIRFKHLILLLSFIFSGSLYAQQANSRASGNLPTPNTPLTPLFNCSEKEIESLLPTATPPGSPGIFPSWSPALKDAVGTSYEEKRMDRNPFSPHPSDSPVWFTVGQGILNEVYYPTIDQPQMKDFQLVFSDGKTYFAEQKKDVQSKVQFLNDGMTVYIRGEEKTGKFTLEQWIVADPSAPVIRIRSRLVSFIEDLSVYALWNPAIQNNGKNNYAHVLPEGLLASNIKNLDGKSVFAALQSATGFQSSSVGYVGCSDGWQLLSKKYRLNHQWLKAGPGNIALTGEIANPTDSKDFIFDLALSFGESKNEALFYGTHSLQTSFEEVQASYEKGWLNYFEMLEKNTINTPSHEIHKNQRARHVAAVIKMHGDKKNPGAMIASLSIPGIPNYVEAPAYNTGGYHLVWPRDLYHSTMGLLSVGDTQTPIHVVNYLMRTQLSDGSWYQNYWVDGSPYWTAIQMDEIAFPIQLIAKLESLKILEMTPAIKNTVKKAAEFITQNGPRTIQERWEEVGGFSPHSIASQIAALRQASRLLGNPVFSETADQWTQNLNKWTAVQQGPLGKNYYSRISPSGNPDTSEYYYIANNGPLVLASSILDGGFLDLVRFQILPWNDPTILSTLKLYESPVIQIASAVPSTKANTYRRYNEDRYGAFNIGGYWPLLAGEKGIYSIAANDLPLAWEQLKAMEFAFTPSGLLPEQVISSEKPGHIGINVPTPLAWSHAQYLTLLRSLHDKKVFDFIE